MSKYLAFMFVIIGVACTDKEGPLFEILSINNSNIDFVNKITTTNDLNILDYLYFYNGGGVAIGDINNDGLPDIYFSGNQVNNKLYLNKGDLRFEDITDRAGVAGESTWNTGAVMGDINGDGYLDIYVCAVVGINGFKGFNELFINNRDGTFTESASKYGLDFESYSSNAAFLDYDLDGDLDIYLLNHAIHTQESFGKADLRRKRNYQSGDKLLRNDLDKFVDVSEESKIFGGVNGYGLGVAIADFNQDGYPDIYVGNDFHEDDYYYINNTDCTFTECLRDFFGHITRFSMGNDVTDINHDGWPDILSLDMLPNDEEVLKSTEGDDNIQVQKLRVERYNYYYQYTRNMLHINQGHQGYEETALLSGIEATDWSWSSLFADYNQDGEQDLFISNGIPKRPNDLDFIKFVSSDKIQKKIDNTKLVDKQALDMMPSGAVHNYLYKGTGGLKFIDKSGIWTPLDTFISGATAFGDLDNDGDLDLVVNNINSPAALYINTTNRKSSSLTIKFEFEDANYFGIGTKVFAYASGMMQYKELYTVRGFQASSEPIIHFGFGNAERVDSLKIVWPNRTYQWLRSIPTNQTLIIKPTNALPFNYSSIKLDQRTLFKRIDNNLGIEFTHIEDNYIDFNRQKLIPYQISDRGPATAIGDINNDGKNDIFFGGSKYTPATIFIQKDSFYTEYRNTTIRSDSVYEDVAAIIIDLDNNGRNDLFIGAGGGDFYNKMNPLLDRYYLEKNSNFIKFTHMDYFENTSVIKPYDLDNDGILEFFVGSNAVSYDFGKIPNSYLFKYENDSISVIENSALQQAGMITDAVWSDFDNDGIRDLIMVGEWMPPKFFKNDNGILYEIELLEENLNGLWQSIEPFDIDHDGDTDYLLGNWGANTKFEASNKYPMMMHYGDFDNNGRTETIVSVEKEGQYYPLLGLDDLSSQLVSLKKKFTTYKYFAGKTLSDVFDKGMLDNAILYKVHELQSGYLKNGNGIFTFVPFRTELQVAPITAYLTFDFNGDGKEEVLVGGNYFGVTPFHGRFDSFSGALIKSEEIVYFGHQLGLNFRKKAVRSLDIIRLNNEPFLLVTINNARAEVYQLTK